MDRAVFDLKMSTEATSLYILICSFSDQGIAPTRILVRSRWSGDDEDFLLAIDELLSRRVLGGIVPQSDEDVFQLNPHPFWDLKS